MLGWHAGLSQHFFVGQSSVWVLCVSRWCECLCVCVCTCMYTCVSGNWATCVLSFLCWVCANVTLCNSMIYGICVRTISRNAIPFVCCVCMCMYCVCMCASVCAYYFDFKTPTLIFLSSLSTHTHTHTYTLQGSAKLEKAEILQMTVDHLRHLHQTRDARGRHAIHCSVQFSVHFNIKARFCCLIRCRVCLLPCIRHCVYLQDTLYIY